MLYHQHNDLATSLGAVNQWQVVLDKEGSLSRDVTASLNNPRQLTKESSINKPAPSSSETIDKGRLGQQHAFLAVDNQRKFNKEVSLFNNARLESGLTAVIYLTSREPTFTLQCYLSFHPSSWMNSNIISNNFAFATKNPTMTSHPNPIGTGQPLSTTKASPSCKEPSTTRPLPLVGLVCGSSADQSPPQPVASTAQELNDILHNTLLLIELYRTKYPEPESHPSLRPLLRPRPIEYYHAFSNEDERRLLELIETLGKNLHILRMQRQEEELVWLRSEATRGASDKEAAEPVARNGKLQEKETATEKDGKSVCAELEDTTIDDILTGLEELVDADDKRITSRFFEQQDPDAVPRQHTRLVLQPPSKQMEDLWNSVDANVKPGSHRATSSATRLQARSAASVRQPVHVSQAPAMVSNEADMTGFSSAAGRNLNFYDLHRAMLENEASKAIKVAMYDPVQAALDIEASKASLAAWRSKMKTTAEGESQRGLQQWMLAQEMLEKRLKASVASGKISADALKGLEDAWIMLTSNDDHSNDE
jgi:hypothetical protein